MNISKFASVTVVGGLIGFVAGTLGLSPLLVLPPVFFGAFAYGMVTD